MEKKINLRYKVADFGLGGGVNDSPLMKKTEIPVNRK